MFEMALAAETVDRVSDHPVSYAFWGVTITVFLAIAVYVIVRAGSIAYFRTKLEAFRAMLREGERNGES